jgi:hypothetical protein
MRILRLAFWVLLEILGIGTGLLQAADRQGATLRVFMNDGQSLQGELLAVLDRELVLYDWKGKSESKVNIDRVEYITVVRKSKFDVGLLNGAGIGVAAGIASSASNNDISREYTPIIAPTLFGIAGGILGCIGGIMAGGDKNYFLQELSSAEIEQLLGSLRHYARKEDVRIGWLGRFRVSWRPFFHSYPAFALKGASALPEGVTQYDTGLSENEIKIYHSKDRQHPHRIGRMRIEYGLSDRLSVGLEVVSSGDRIMRGYSNPEVSLNGQPYSSTMGVYGFSKAWAGLLGVSQEVPLLKGIPSPLRGEIGVGLAHTDMTLASDFGISYSYFRSVTPALQIGASIEFSPSAALSSGVFISYLYLPASFPGMKAIGSLNFYPGNTFYVSGAPSFKQSVDFSMPKSRINMGGLNIGVLIRIR